MIEVEFRRPGERGQYVVAATLRVDDAGTATWEGDASSIDVDAPIRDRSRPSGQLTFREDPEQWARNASKAFRTPYLVPVVIKDTGAS